VAPLDVAHRDVGKPVELSCVVDVDDVRMVEGRRDARLADEALTEPRILGDLWREDLECDLPAESQMLGEVDDAHPAAADDALESMACYLVARAEVELHGAVVSLPQNCWRVRVDLVGGCAEDEPRHSSREAR